MLSKFFTHFYLQSFLSSFQTFFLSFLLKGDFQQEIPATLNERHKANSLYGPTTTFWTLPCSFFLCCLADQGSEKVKTLYLSEAYPAQSTHQLQKGQRKNVCDSFFNNVNIMWLCLVTTTSFLRSHHGWNSE